MALGRNSGNPVSCWLIGVGEFALDHSIFFQERKVQRASALLKASGSAGCQANAYISRKNTKDQLTLGVPLVNTLVNSLTPSILSGAITGKLFSRLTYPIDPYVVRYLTT